MSNSGYEFDIPMIDAANNVGPMSQRGGDKLSTEGVLLAYDNRSTGSTMQNSNKLQYVKPQQAKLDPAGEVHKPKPHEQFQIGVEKNESKIVWDAWTNRVLKQAIANIKSEGDRYRAQTGTEFESGIVPQVNFRVDSQGQVSRVELVESSGDEAWDRVVVQGLKKLAGNPILRFPKGSHRQSMSFDGYTFSTGNHSSNPNVHDGDEEVVDN